MTPNAVEMLPEVVASHDEPFGDPSSIPTWYLCRMARKHVTVALSGDGGDELLAGYARYVTIAEEHRRLVRWPTLANQAYARLGSLLPVESRVRNKAVRANLPPPARYAMFRTNFNAAMRRKLLSQEVLRQVDQDATSYLFKDVATPFREDDGLSPLMACDFATYLPDDVLTKVDRMSMAHSLEARVPLLDHRVVEFLQTLPISYLFNRGRTKNILRDIIEPHLPQEVLTHRKQGFSVPLKKWFKNELREQLEDAVEGETFRSSEIFNHRYVKRIFDLHQKDRFDLSWQLWQLMIFSRWYQNAR
jgi:asparagine synthase (glutamine-hydrolysing)